MRSAAWWALLAVAACGGPAAPAPATTTTAPDSPAAAEAAPGQTETSAAAASGPPAADAYRWLEEIEGQRALDWVRAINEATAKQLAGARYDALYSDALAILSSPGRLPSLSHRGGYVYDHWRDEAHPRGVYRRATLKSLRAGKPRWETVLDIDALARAEGEPWAFKGASCLPPRYTRCMIGLARGGTDAAVRREYDVGERAFVTGGFALPEAKTWTVWLDRDHLMLGAEQTASGYPRVARIWKRGTPLASAETIYEGDAASVMVIGQRYGDGDDAVDLVTEMITFLDKRRFQRVDGELIELALPRDADLRGVYAGGAVAELESDWTVGGQTYPAGAVVYAPLAALRDGAGAVELVGAPSDSSVVDRVAVTKAGLLVLTLDNVRSRLAIARRDRKGRWTTRPVALPESGAISVMSSSEDSSDVLVTYEDFLTPRSLYYLDARRRQPKLLQQQTATFDASRFAIRQHTVTSADGTRVPYFVVGPEELPPTGDHPTLMFSYGGFGNTLQPSYSGSYEELHGAYGKLWLERGGVFVLANIRGGAEFGPAWHRAALEENRPRSFEDFEAIARDLVARKITSPAHLGIEGRSNGGLLVTATMVRHPELYGAVVSGVPLTDMQRYSQLLAGASWVAEYGDPTVPAQWEFLRRYSPFHNVTAGADYPPILFYTSTRDDRVHPGHARKLAHKLVDQGHEVFYYENIEGGHHGSVTPEQLAHRLALVYTFLWEALR